MSICLRHISDSMKKYWESIGNAPAEPLSMEECLSGHKNSDGATRRQPQDQQ